MQSIHSSHRCDRELATGQNPASAVGVANEMPKRLK